MMKRAQVPVLSFRFLVAAMIACLGNIESNAAAPDHSFVPGYQRLMAAETPDEFAAGALLLGELNCASCHKGSAAKHIASKQAPLLGNVAGRASIDSIRKFIANPHATKPGTTMPDVLAGMPEKDRAAAADALTHYLVSLKSSDFAHSRADPGAKSRGEAAFNAIGCVACHAPRNKEDAKLAATSVPLGDVKSKYSLASLTKFLRDPLAVRPAGRMPSLNLTSGEAADLAAYLTDAVEMPARLTYSYYEGDWSKTPDFAKMKPKSTGKAQGFNVTGFPRSQNFGLVWQAYLTVDQAGEYTFSTNSDDGSMLYIGEKLVVNNDGTHGNATKSGKIRLASGRHPIRVTYFNKGGPFGLSVEYDGPGVKKQPIPHDRLVGANDDTPLRVEKKLSLDASLVAKGKTLFATTGCASCHQLGGKHAAVASKIAAPNLDGLKAAAGCVSGKAAAGRPSYHLSPQQTASLAKTIGSFKRGLAKTPSAKQAITHDFAALNCYACHDRDGLGGVDPLRDAFFTSNGDDLGPEGRFPPSLTGVGDKLKTEWLSDVLVASGTARSYINVRMPQFGKANVGHLPAILAKLDQKSPAPEVKLPAKVARKAGHQLVGKTGMSCISCHSFHRFKSTGIQATDLSMMAKRLRKDWFHRYMLNPQLFRRGTRMPSSWPNGKSQKPDILNGNTDQQISAVYDYLSDSRKARIPFGLIVASNSMELVADFEAMMYRNFIQGAGPRAIGVGLPSKLNYAFDAQNVRLALIWQGRFISGAKHWSGRGQGFQPPLGDKVVSLANGPTLAFLADEKAPWPTETGRAAGFKFRGYRLDELRRPTLMYYFGDVRITEYYVGDDTNDGAVLKRTVTITSSKDIKNLWYRAAAGGNIGEAKGGAYNVAGQFTTRIKLGGDAKPLVRKSELLVPIVLRDGKASFTQELLW